MIPGVGPIHADSLAFAVISLGLVACAWSGARRHFPCALAAASGILVASWLTPLDLAALAAFLVPPYFVVRRAWGIESRAASGLAAAVIAWEVLLFVYLRKYQLAGDIAWLEHPVAIVGLSYMLFRVIHLIVEAPYLGHLPFGPLRYATYVGAFWTLLSGPIQRYDGFANGIAAAGRPDDTEALAAGHRLINGLIKAFLLAPVCLRASPLEALSVSEANWIDFAIVLYAYPAYLYLNFSGYTDMVIAIARLCGVNTLPENFNRPYLARNVMDFWTRWHMSFGTWIRHYIFTPMSKHLMKAAPPALQNGALAVAVIVTFVIVGAWHGTTLNFVIFGILHGVAIIAITVYGRMLKALFDRQRRKAFENHPVVRGISVVLCFHFVCATILLFPNSVGDLGRTFGAFFRTQGWL